MTNLSPSMWKCIQEIADEAYRSSDHASRSDAALKSCEAVLANSLKREKTKNDALREIMYRTEGDRVNQDMHKLAREALEGEDE